jgi:monofunctional biosynthetic peptidoglycan transglycosylase
MRPSPLVTLLLFASIAAVTIAEAKQTVRTMFDFAAADVDQWQIVNDGVMGGLSTSKVGMTADAEMRFYGNLSLKNNGGFASVRSKPRSLGLNTGDALQLRVRGDGRKYTFNLYIPTQRVAFSYQADFETKADEWTEITLPLDSFQAKSFGRPVRDPKLDPLQVNSIGILLGDKKPGAFQIVVDWIKITSQD